MKREEEKERICAWWLVYKHFGGEVESRTHLGLAGPVVLDQSGSFLFPLVEFLEPIVEGFGGSGESEDDINKAFVLGTIDEGMPNFNLLRQVGELADLDDFPAHFVGAFFLKMSLVEKNSHEGRENDRKKGEGLTKAANRHAWERLAES